MLSIRISTKKLVKLLFLISFSKLGVRYVVCMCSQLPSLAALLVYSTYSYLQVSRQLNRPNIISLASEVIYKRTHENDKEKKHV